MEIKNNDKIIGEVNFVESIDDLENNNKEAEESYNTEVESEPNYKYVGIVFEDRYNKGKFKGNCYNYKTTRDLKEGQVIVVPTKFGQSKGCVVHADVDPETIDYPLDSLLEV